MSSEIVFTPLGKIHGAEVLTETTNTLYYKFCGIPYAEPPLGHLRFLPPKLIEKWSNVIDGSKERDECSQFSLFSLSFVGSEDCLYLNVFTPERPSKITKPKPVIIQIHGGGHFWGSSNKKCFGDPDYFMHKDVILVNFNYRLHVLGFLNLDLPKCSGNMGLKDQRTALQWVKTNIKYFGGDPDNITLYGNSSASCDIHFHMMNPISQKLFHRTIMQCGYALNPCWSYQENHVERAMKFGHSMGFKGTNTKNLLKFFKQQDVSVLSHAVMTYKKLLVEKNRAKYEVCPFLPSIEIPQENAFMTRSPRELIYLTPPKPMICSITSKEGSLAFCADPLSMINEIFPIIVRENLWMYKMTNATLNHVCQELRNFYFGNVCKIDYAMADKITDFYTDMWYNEWHTWINSMASKSESTPLYLYCFDYDGSLNYNQKFVLKLSHSNLKGPCHADDAAYFMMYRSSHNSAYVIKKNSADWMTVLNMTTLLTNFAKTGNPNGGTIPETNWCPYTVNDPSHLIFDAEGVKVVKKIINEERVPFWKKIIEYIKEHEKDTD